VIYPVSAVPAQVRWAVRLNPLTPIFEGLRLAFLGVGVATPSQLAISSVGMLATLGAGLLLLTRVERTFMDTV
jgi:homopolymeric O-antigen transport system permease protein